MATPVESPNTNKDTDLELEEPTISLECAQRFNSYNQEVRGGGLASKNE